MNPGPFKYAGSLSKLAGIVNEDCGFCVAVVERKR
jgi:hypothetical protein